MAGQKTITVPIGGMSCQHCVQTIKGALSALPGVTDAVVTLDPPQAVVTGDNVGEAEIRASIEDQGFDTL